MRYGGEPSTSVDEVEFSLTLDSLWEMAPIDSRDAQDRPFRVHLTGFGVRLTGFSLSPFLFPTSLPIALIYAMSSRSGTSNTTRAGSQSNLWMGKSSRNRLRRCPDTLRPLLLVVAALAVQSFSRPRSSP